MKSKFFFSPNLLHVAIRKLIVLISTKTKILYNKLVHFISPNLVEWEGASYGLILGILIMLLVTALAFVQFLGWIVPILFIFSRLLMGLVGGLLIYLLLSLYQFPPKLFRWVLIGSIVILSQYWPGNIMGKTVLMLGTVLSFSFLFGTSWSFFHSRLSDRKIKNKILSIIFFILGSAGICLGGYGLLIKGWPCEIPENAALKSEAEVSQITLQDPSKQGNYTVKYLTYGSGKDLHRDEFGENVSIVTDSVDGSPFVKNWKKFHGWVRTKYWGFNEKALPLNARVWYPDENGPFPLVLIVHGNHLDQDYSDPGYEYLGTLLASRGFIVVSVDENFLNSSWANMFDHLKEENDCRGWLLLKHLEKWHEWNGDVENSFFQKVDTTNIALIGHSRGGEAVAIAGLFNDLPYYPDDATVSFNFGFQIKTIIAIAPVDGQYKPGNTGTVLHNVNYFSIQGAHDMDMTSYHGAIQYQRTFFSDDNFHVKAGLYVNQANHGQFNTVWGDNDVGIPGITIYNRKTLMSEDDQMIIGKVFIIAFLEATLNKKKEYLNLFRDYRTGLEWLPETIYLNQYEDTHNKILIDFEEDLDLSTGSITKSKIGMQDLTVWREREIPLKWRSYETKGVYVGWNRETTDSMIAEYVISMPPIDFFTSDSMTHLYCNLADANENSNPKPDESKNGNKISESNEKKNTQSKKKKKSNQKRDPINISVAIIDAQGNEASIPISEYAYIQPQLEPHILKADFMTDGKKSEIIFQSFFLPFSLFLNQNAQINLSEIRQIKFVFDKSEEGVIIIDDIGLWREI